MSKVTNTTAEDVRTSVSSIYAELINRRKAEKEAKAEQKRLEKELHEQEKEDKNLKEDGTRMTKKERRQAEFDSWKEIVIGLTGDDLEYSSKKKGKKKKYRKWIDDEDTGTVTTVKQKKPKKKNYNKEFEPELAMLRALVAEQNRFTADLQKRFQLAAGPATKDGMPPNKTMVELASAIMSGRTNSLGMLREIGTLKKAIADLYMKQRKLDSELSGGSTVDNTDIALMGSSIAASMFGGTGTQFNGDAVPQMQAQTVMTQSPPPVTPAVIQAAAGMPMQNPIVQAEAFDPESWEGPQLENSFAQFESIPHSIVVEKNQSTGSMRFAAYRDDNGEELIGCNIPTVDPTTLVLNETDMTVKGPFDEVYPLKYVG